MTDPFAIATVDLESGARLGVSPMPGRAGDLAADVLAILAWAPAMVVSMTPVEEMRRHGSENLGDILGQAGISHHSFPVTDYGAPDGGEDWGALANRLHQCLDDGGAVLIHCAGGCGRSGMAVLRLMVERGEDGNSALARLRQVRPCAVETAAQMQWSMAGA
jgi:protein-tyrosine phosphatase